MLHMHCFSSCLWQSAHKSHQPHEMLPDVQAACSEHQCPPAAHMSATCCLPACAGRDCPSLLCAVLVAWLWPFAVPSLGFQKTTCLCVIQQISAPAYNRWQALQGVISANFLTSIRWRFATYYSITSEQAWHMTRDPPSLTQRPHLKTVTSFGMQRSRS